MHISRSARTSAFVLGLCGCAADGTTTELSSAANAGGGGGGPVSGAIFTTTVTGARVNANIYPAKSAVYLDGGPGNAAPSGAAALPAGDYYFQVTDPSGHTLLSQDAVECRRVRVSTDGVIDTAYAGPGGCQHATGIDQDHASLGAVTVALMPYADTPNHGGEYKAWMTPVADLGDDGSFVNRYSKTDNFKIRAITNHPVCGNGIVENDEQCDDGNAVSGDGCSATCHAEVPPPSCGNGIVETGEQCDDGNAVNGDGCSASCQTEVPPPPPPPSCCGNGIVEAGEQCDDGNTTAGDGCSATCQTEAPPPPPPPAPVCGNGIIELNEECDDGNALDGDGCSASCHLELDCQQTPSPQPPLS